MDQNFQSVSSADWQTVVNRLNNVGVFADEERKFPSESALRSSLRDFESQLRINGYTGGSLTLGAMSEPEDGVDFLVFDQNRVATMLDALAAWRSEYSSRWHTKVDASVNDWIKRLTDLKAAMKSWLPPDMSIVDLPPTNMHEELMKRFGVPSAKMPTFEIVRGSQRKVRVQPKGLWVLGANGRVDMTTPTASYIVVDESPPRSGNPNWKYYTSRNKRLPVKLDQASFVSLLNQ